MLLVFLAMRKEGVPLDIGPTHKNKASLSGLRDIANSILPLRLSVPL